MKKDSNAPDQDAGAAPPKPTVRSIALRTLETVAIAGAGAALFTALRFPAGAILGAIVATALASFAGRRLGLPPPLRLPLLFIVGLGVGATITPSAFEAAMHWPLSILALCVVSLFAWWSSARIFQILCKTDLRTSAYAMAPGAISVSILLANAAKADVHKVTVAQTCRATAFVCLVPLALGVGDIPRAQPSAVDLDGLHWAIAIGAALLGCLLARKLSWPLPFFLGAILGSAIVHATGLSTVQVPPLLLSAATAGLGAVIGSRFSEIQPSVLWRHLPASAATTLFMALICVPAGIVAGMLAGVGPLAGFVAFCPGAAEMMISVSLALNIEPSFVTVHQLARFALLMVSLPFFHSTLFARKEKSQPPAD